MLCVIVFGWDWIGFLPFRGSVVIILVGSFYLMLILKDSHGLKGKTLVFTSRLDLFILFRCLTLDYRLVTQKILVMVCY